LRPARFVLALAALALADFAETAYALASGAGAEVNPIVTGSGAPPLLALGLLKGAYVFGLWATRSFAGRSRWTRGVVLGMLGMYAAVVAWNLGQLLL
jgi:hypothetical protein